MDDSNVERIVRELVATGKWSDRNVRLSLRAGFKCEYCGLDFLASPENYKQWECDHIIPTGAGGSDDFDNLAVACRTCNYCFKNRWNPQSKAGDNANRAELIEIVKRYIHDRRALTEQQIARERAIIGAT